MTIKVQDIIDIINNRAECIQNELLDCCSHFLWNQFPEGWYQFALMRELRHEGYRSYPEYWLGHLLHTENGKTDIALFERQENEFKNPAVLIEVKSVGSKDNDFTKDAKRLIEVAKKGKDGILVYFTGAIEKSDRDKTRDKFFSCCKREDTTALVTDKWHPFQKWVFKMPTAEEEGGLGDREWGVLTATFSGRRSPT